MNKFVSCLALLSFLYPVAANAAEKPVLDAGACRQMMVEYQPPADINQNADYKPGVDVKGKPVVEADINPSAVTVPDVISFPLTVDVARYANIPRPIGTEADALMGYVTIDTKTNKMTYNGQPLENATVTALRDLCAEEKPVSPILQGNAPSQNILKGNSGNADILKGSRGNKPILQGDLPAMPKPAGDIKKATD